MYDERTNGALATYLNPNLYASFIFFKLIRVNIFYHRYMKFTWCKILPNSQKITIMLSQVFEYRNHF